MWSRRFGAAACLVTMTEHARACSFSSGGAFPTSHARDPESDARTLASRRDSGGGGDGATGWSPSRACELPGWKRLEHWSLHLHHLGHRDAPCSPRNPRPPDRTYMASMCSAALHAEAAQHADYFWRCACGMARSQPSQAHDVLAAQVTLDHLQPPIESNPPGPS